MAIVILLKVCTVVRLGLQVTVCGLAFGRLAEHSPVSRSECRERAKNLRIALVSPTDAKPFVMHSVLIASIFSLK